MDVHRERLARVEHNKALARKLNTYDAVYTQAKQSIQSVEASKATIESRIAETSSKLTALQSVNPPTGDVSNQIATLAPQLAQDQNKLAQIEIELTQLASELSQAETNLIASQRALDELAKPELLPLSVQLGLKRSRSSRVKTDDRLAKVQQLLVLGRAALKIEARQYNVRAGDRPAVGAMQRFYELNGVVGKFAVPCCFDESGTLPYGSGVWVPFVDEVNSMLADVRVAVAALEVEESQLLAKASSGLEDDQTAIESVYVKDLKAELALV